MRTDDFLYQYGIHPDNVSQRAVTAAFSADMSTGLSGLPSSLKMLPSFLSPGGDLMEGETALAVDVGGTALKIALTQVIGGTIEIITSDVSPVPGHMEEMTIETFFAQLAERLLPFIRQCSRVGISFAHAVAIAPDWDGRLISFSKEMKISGGEGLSIGRALSDQLQMAGVTAPKKFVVLNDATAVYLGGLTYLPETCQAPTAALVLGTGINISYVETAERIFKLPGTCRPAAMVINTEAGGFDKLPLGSIDSAFLQTTDVPTSHVFEKLTGGRYLGPLVLFALKKAAEEGLLSKTAASSIRKAAQLTTPELSALLEKGGGLPNGKFLDDNDKAVIRAVAEAYVSRAAKLAAAAVAAVLDQTRAGEIADRPAVVIAEGSTFLKLYSFRQKFETALKENCLGGYPISVFTRENAAILGAAQAAMTAEK
ncbi:hypothetical protein AAFA46_00050 [Oscillospiraceae bacterium WX1]